MRLTMVALAVIFLAACSTTSTQPQEIEATRDFVAAADLEEVSEIRIERGGLRYTYVNDRYVIIPTRRGDYLAEFRRDCFELRQRFDERDMGEIGINSPKADTRRDSKLYAGTDTIRGCYIEKLYEVSKVQVAELRALGDAPGDETYLPEKDK